ncbi:AIR carboxylase family protein [Stieleria sp. ICT_E10.1]|uniref:AIR carboxylase family protein n=1 Tax=Stieleria sedimenti TaxID=2976331 RepID=UPI00217FD293|nr:AIR carboxylase family protein [Stieleria sedimenti]MCS7469816.1 AIR carboxylase family protein [Stieleria sedimenti]
MPLHPPPHPSHQPDPQDLARLLTDVATGRISASDALATLTADPLSTSRLTGSNAAGSNAAGSNAAGSNAAGSNAAGGAAPDRVTLDLDRQRRCGFPEVIYGDGKPADMIAAIIQAQQDAGQPSFATRVAAAVAEQVQTQVPAVRFNPVARTLTAGISEPPLPTPLPTPLPRSQDTGAVENTARVTHVAVVTAGSTDAPVAEEAIETLHWMGIPFRQFDDIGVAGPARLLAAVPHLREAAAVVVIAGMEGALPAAVGGHLSVPVFAVPTSVGYGATLGGLTAMLGMLSSCASNVAVVNIDAGFKAAYLAGLVVRQLQRAP